MDIEKELNSLGWLGDIKNVVNVGDYKVIEVLHNKISNRISDETGFHIFLKDGKSHWRYYPTFGLALIAIGCLDSGVTDDTVGCMARVAGIDPNVISKEETTLNHEGFVPHDPCIPEHANQLVEVIIKKKS